jgi:hypothetical protein
MFQENEVVMLVLGIGVLLFIVKNLEQVKRIFLWKILIGSYYILLSGWFFTVIEGFFLEYYFNLLEHICYAVSTVMVAVWCWKSTFRIEEEKLL